MPPLFAIFAALLYDPQMLLPIVGGTSSAPAPPLAFFNSSTKECGSGSAACTLTYSPTAGHLLVVSIRGYGTSTATVTDNASGGSSTYATNNTDTSMYAASSCNTKAGATSITVTFNTAPPFGGGFSVLEFSGQKTSSCYDTSTAMAGPTVSQSMSSNSLSPAGSGEVSVMTFKTDSGIRTISGTNGYACYYVENTTGGEALGSCYLIKTDATAQVATGDWNSASTQWTNFQSAWKPGP